MNLFFKTLYIKGVTLVEIMVAISIFTIVTAVVLFNHTTFNANILVTNLAYEIALSIRQAQVYGLSVRQELGESESFNYAYGVYFSPSFNNKFYLYADKNNDKNFNPAEGCTDPEDECLEEFTLRNGVVIDEIKAGGVFADEYLNILFQRPNPEAVIILDGDVVSPPQSDATIVIKSERTNKEKTIRIDRTGQISVQQ